MLSLANKLGLSDTTKDSYSMQFNGTTQSVSVDNLAGDMDEEKGTIAAWINLNTVSASVQVLKSKVDSNNFIQLFYHAGSNEMRIVYKGGGAAESAVMTDALEGQGWKHIVCTWDTTEDEIKIYLNGTLKGTTGSLGTFSGSLSEADIGQNTTDGAYWNGKLDEVAVFTEVVSATTLYNGGSPVDLTGITGLIGYYKFEEGSGTSQTFDSSGQGNTGTLNNSPTYSTDTP